MGVFLATVLVASLLLSSTAEYREDDDDWFLKTIDAIQRHFRSGCVFLYLRPETGDIDRSSVLNKIISTVKESRVSTLVVQLGEQSSMMRKKSHPDCSRPLHVLPSNYEPRLLNTSSWNSRSNNKKQPTWLQFVSSSNDLDRFLDGVDVPFDCQFLVAQRDKEVVRLIEVFRVREDLPLQRFHFGTWRPVEGLQATTLGFHDRRNNLEGIVLRAGVISEALATIDRIGSEIKISGFSTLVFHELAQKLNFTLNYTVSTDSYYGTIHPNGTVDGMIRKISEREVDLVVNPLFFTPGRKVLFDYTVPVVLRRYKLFIRMPNKTTFKWTHFFAPFSPQLWLTIGVTVLFIGLFVNGVSMYGHVYHQRTGNQHFSRFGYSQALFSIIRIFLQQGYEATPNSATVQVIFIAALLTSLVLLAAYSGVLISFITISEIELPFQDIHGLMDNPSYKVGVLGVPSEYTTMSKNDGNGSTDLHLLSTRIQEDLDPPKTILEGLMRVCNSKYAFLISVNEAMKYKEAIPCHIVPVPKVSYKASLGFLMTKNNPYRTTFNHALITLESNGILKKIRFEFAPQKWPIMEDYVNVGADLENVVPILVLLLVGVTTAVALLVAEGATYRLLHRNQGKTRRQFLP